MRHAHEPGSRERDGEVAGVAWARPLAEDNHRAEDREDRLHLLQDDGRDEVVVREERFGEQDRGDRRGAGADCDRREDVTPAEPEDSRKRTGRERQRQHDEYEVLAEDDRRGRRRRRQRPADPLVEPPERRSERDERDAGRSPHAENLARDLVVEDPRAYFTVVGMFVIFPEAICALICRTFAAIPCGVFGENLPIPTPLTSRP